MNHAGLVRFVQRSRGLRHDVEHLLGRQGLVALENLGERVAGHKLHHEIGAAAILAVIKNVRDSLVLNASGVTGLGSKALKKAGVAHVFGLENLDRHVAQNNLVVRLPNLTHAADGDARFEAVSRTVKHLYFWLHLFNTACMTLRATGAASELPRPF